MTAADQFFTKVPLLLHGEGSNGGTTFTDSSQNARTVSKVGTVTTSTAHPKYGTASLAFTGGSGANYLSCASSPDFAFPGDLTVEAYVYWTTKTAGKADNIFSVFVNNGFSLYWDGGLYNANTLKVSNYGISDPIQYSWSPTVGQLYHIAVTRSGTTVRLFIDGTVVATATISTSFVQGEARIGGVTTHPAGISTIDGYIDELRITKGWARYTANFTPDAAAFPDDGTRATSIGNVVTFGAPVAPHFATSMGTIVHFGTPLTPLPATSLGNVVTFGTPTGFRQQVASSIGNVVTFGTPRLKNIARSWTAVTFGIPATPLPATSIGNVVTFGTPRQQRRMAASSIGKVVTFGTPTTPTTRTCEASSWVAVVFNTPVALIMEPLNVDRVLPAVSLPRGVTFGRPAARTTVTAAASSLSPVTFGTPTSRVTPRCQASSVGSVVSFGTPHSAMHTHAHTWDAVTFGTPTSRRVCTASSIPSRVHFGTPSYRRANGHAAYSWLAVRFGQPRVRTGMFRAATSLGTVVTFGTPTATQHHRVLPNESPVVTFGTPLAVRNPRC